MYSSFSNAICVFPKQISHILHNIQYVKEVYIFCYDFTDPAAGAIIHRRRRDNPPPPATWIATTITFRCWEFRQGRTRERQPLPPPNVYPSLHQLQQWLHRGVCTGGCERWIHVGVLHKLVAAARGKPMVRSRTRLPLLSGDRLHLYRRRYRQRRVHDQHRGLSFYWFAL